MKPLFHPEYGPYNDAYRIKAVNLSEVIGIKGAAKHMHCSESSVRNWQRAYSNRNRILKVEY